MKAILLSFIFAIFVIATQALVIRTDHRRPTGHRPFPTFPGQGPFNQRPTFPEPYRLRRSPQVGGTVTGTVVQPLDGPERRPSVSLDYNHRIYESPYGTVSVTGGAAKNPGHNAEAKVGIQGSISFGPRRPDLFPPSAWDIDENGREKVIP